MTFEEIRRPSSAAPFHPFDLVLTSGRRVRVDHPEFMVHKEYRNGARLRKRKR